MIKSALLYLIAFYLVFGFGLKAQKRSIEKGRKLFLQNCSGCHNFRQDGIGPQLGGLKGEVGVEYIISMIKDSQSMIASNNGRAVNLSQKFKSAMPSFSYLEARDINALTAYILHQPASQLSNERNFGNPVIDPIPGKIPLSDLVLNISPYVRVPSSSNKEPLARISLMSTDPVRKETYLADLRGKLYRIEKDKTEVYLDISKVFPNFMDSPGLATGFGAFAFHPDFENNGLFYTSHSEFPDSKKADFQLADSIKATTQWVVNEWHTFDSNEFPSTAKPKELFRVDMVRTIHGIQEIGFNPMAKKNSEDYGMLYIGVGEGAAAEMGYPIIAHDKKGIWGSLLRIDPGGNNSENGKYGYPNSNPFAGTTYRGEIYAMGFRNPHRFTWTSTGKLLVINIGQKSVETVNVVTSGSDFGWPMREGRLRINEQGDLNFAYNIPESENLNDFNLPAIEIDHDEIGAISTILEYTGSDIPELKGKLLFSSISRARLFYVEEKDVFEGARAEVKEFRVALDGKITSFNELTGNNWRADLRLGRDAEGEIYFFTKRDGMVYKIVP